jgi:hypothetical protein
MNLAGRPIAPEDYVKLLARWIDRETADRSLLQRFKYVPADAGAVVGCLEKSECGNRSLEPAAAIRGGYQPPENGNCHEKKSSTNGSPSPRPEDGNVALPRLISKRLMPPERITFPESA